MTEIINYNKARGALALHYLRKSFGTLATHATQINTFKLNINGERISIDGYQLDLSEHDLSFIYGFILVSYAEFINDRIDHLASFLHAIPYLAKGETAPEMADDFIADETCLNCFKDEINLSIGGITHNGEKYFLIATETTGYVFQFDPSCFKIHTVDWYQPLTLVED